MDERREGETGAAYMCMLLCACMRVVYQSCMYVSQSLVE